MAINMRHIFPGLSDLVTAHNSLKSQIGAGSNFHLDVSEVTITAANATDLATSLTLCNQMIGVLTFHFADTLALKVADATSLPAIGAAVDLASAITATNLMKASYNTHRASTTYHYNADSTNTLATADATDQTSLNTLLNAAKTAINAHLASGASGSAIRLVSA